MTNSQRSSNFKLAAIVHIQYDIRVAFGAFWGEYNAFSVLWLAVFSIGAWYKQKSSITTWSKERQFYPDSGVWFGELGFFTIKLFQRQTFNRQNHPWVVLSIWSSGENKFNSRRRDCFTPHTRSTLHRLIYSWTDTCNDINFSFSLGFISEALLVPYVTWSIWWRPYNTSCSWSYSQLSCVQWLLESIYRKTKSILFNKKRHSRNWRYSVCCCLCLVCFERCRT